MFLSLRSYIADGKTMDSEPRSGNHFPNLTPFNFYLAVILICYCLLNLVIELCYISKLFITYNYFAVSFLRSNEEA
jgi:hypothetical protein